MTTCCACGYQEEPGTVLITSVRVPEAIGLSVETGITGTGSAHEEGPVDQLEPLPLQDTDLNGQQPPASVPPSKQVLSVPSLHGQDNILRATNVGNILSRGGCILQSSSGSAETYLLSKPRPSIDIFISHNWAVPRWRKFWALALYFNVVHAVVVAYICVGIGCLLNAFSVPPVFHFGDLLMRPYCVILGSCGFWLTLVAGHDFPLARRLCYQRQVFLDKVCIHQTDPVLKAAGINHLGAFLRYSKKMLVLFNTVYCKRLWTVYELACYMYLHRRDELELLPVGIASVVLKATLVIQFFHWLSLGLMQIVTALSITDTYPLIFTSLGFATCLIFILAFILRDWALKQSELLSDLHEFQIAKADCADESDRAVVSSNICAFARSMGLVKDDASDADALLSFDKLVQERMPELLRSAVGYAGFPYKYALVAGIGHDFILFDQLSAARGSSALEVTSSVVYNLVVRTALSPQILLVCAMLSKACKPRRGWAEVGVKCGIAAAATASTATLFILANVFAEFAAKSVWWLIVLAAFGVVLAVVVIKLFSLGPGAADPATLALAARKQIRENTWGSTASSAL